MTQMSAPALSTIRRDFPHSVDNVAEIEPLTHLQALEAERIHIMREVAAEAEHPVMLYQSAKILP